MEYRGVNHSAGNIFVYAPEQRVLMLVDVVYPGYMPYPNLGVAVDILGYIQAHREALAYDFTDFVGGHVDRLGTRADVEQSLEFVLDLQRTSEAILARTPSPVSLREKHRELRGTWFAHDDYERACIARCYASLAPKWSSRLKGTERSLARHCRAMIVALAIQFPAGGGPSGSAPRKRAR